MARAKKTEEVNTTEEVKGTEAAATEEVKAAEETSAAEKEEPAKEAKTTEETATVEQKTEVKAPIEAMADKIVDQKNEKKMSKKEKEEAEDQAQLDSLKDTDFRVVAKLLQDIRDDNEKQMRYVRTQLRFTQFFTVFLVLIIVCMSIGIASYVPVINKLISDSNTVIEQTNMLMQQASGVLENLDTVTAELAKTDISGMMEDVDSLVISSEESMATAVGKIEAIDIDSLNKAIKDLQSVVSPLAKLFGRK
ncbi:MAG: hypothetical protein Q4G60_05040 [bacterium]|nr:hypothetical protein [bacterium]